ncbi:hypothetical protein [Bdellovibrio sp. KM01]|uniref:hypothetical protein n=1 Tax=Bdellovibrio sp. KM01 TaxID=2748865 RepID=UPI0015E9259C|nr:hypothetical protein [Bdellovibrio sp. KM01]QLY26050.1 hypothetical protein HW988_03185 [Bdellovibrio sp. KM01]
MQSKIVFSNEKEYNGLLKLMYVAGFAMLIPLFTWWQNNVNPNFDLWLLAILAGICVLLFSIRRAKIMNVVLLENCIELEYPLRDHVQAIPYSELLCAEYVESSFSLSLVLKDSRTISLPAKIEKVEGHFPPYQEMIEARGEAGDRYRLKHEIDSRIKGKDSIAPLKF